jgi:FG-GAP repeat
MTANPQILEENRSTLWSGGQSHYESAETANSHTLEDGAEHNKDNKETPRSSSLIRHSCTRRFWIALLVLLVIVLVIGLSSLGVHIVQRNKGSDDRRPNTHLQVGPDLDGKGDRDRFGWSVALSSDGTRVAIGAPGNYIQAGQVRVHDWTGSQWTQVGSDLDGEADRDRFGSSVALSSDGTRVAIGAPYNGDNSTMAGHVRVYDWTGSQWTQVGSDLNGETAYNYFGSSVALSSDGTRVVIGATGNGGLNGDDYGRVRVYDWTGSQWTQVGSNLDGEAAYDSFGYSVALSSDGTRVAIGAPSNDENGDYSGHVRVYDWTGSLWTQVGSDLDGEAAYGSFGSSVALSSDGIRVVIGAPRRGGLNGDNYGRVRVYDWTGSQWMQVGSNLDGASAEDRFGWSVALSSNGTRVAIGAPSFRGSGDVRIYDWTGSQWAHVGSDLDGEAAGDEFGSSVALSSNGTRVAIGAIYNDGDAEDAGHVRVYNVSA